MKLLVDTSVWSLTLRRKDGGSLSPDEKKLKAELVQAIQDGRVAMLGLIRQELLSGIKEKAQFEKVKAALDAYVDEPINSAAREYAARITKSKRGPQHQRRPDQVALSASLKSGVEVGQEITNQNGASSQARAVKKAATLNKGAGPAIERIQRVELQASIC